MSLSAARVGNLIYIAPFLSLVFLSIIIGEEIHPSTFIGLFLIIGSILLYSRIGKKEGINFKRNKWIFAIIGATFLGASSGLYDKFLIQTLALNPQTLQFWFCWYTLLILLVILSVTWFPYKEKRKAFTFRWTIIAVGFLLVAADYFYFKALQDPDALIMLLSAIKRSQILITVVIGGLVFKEKNKRKKLIPLGGIIVGVGLILYS